MAHRYTSSRNTWSTHLGLVRMGMLLLMLIGFFGLNRLQIGREFAPMDQKSAASSNSVDLQEADVEPSTNDLPDIADLDPALEEALSLIQDKTFELKPVEMQAYWKLLQHVRDMSVEDLNSRCDGLASIHGLFQKPAEYRGKVSKHEMIVRRVLKYDATTKDAKTNETLYEIWGSPDNARNWLFVLISPQLPEGCSEKSAKGRKVEMTGFFFKLQAYHPANGKSSDKPLLAPLFLGKLREIQSPVPQSREIFSDWGAVVTMIVVCIVLAGLYFYLIRRTESKSRRPLIEKADRESLLLWMSAPEEQSSPGDAKLAASPTGAKQWRDD